MKKLLSRRRALVAPLAFLAACAGGVAEIPPASSPASPRGEEARFIAATSLDPPDPLLTLVPPEAAPATMPMESKPPPESPPRAVYTCPMHPDVRLPAPGQCPKCGMKLAPAKPSSAVSVTGNVPVNVLHMNFPPGRKSSPQ